MYPRLRSKFLRGLVESLYPGAEGALLGMVRSRLPSRLASVAETVITTSRDPVATIPLDDAEALLFEIDSVLGDGSGTALETAGRSLAARILTEGSVTAVADLAVAARVLRAHLEQAFEDVRLFYDLDSSNHEIALTLGIAGRPRSARILRHLVIGYFNAAATAAGLSPSSYRVRSEMLGDRAAIELRTERRATPNAQTPVRRPSSTIRAAPSISMRAPGTLAEVERILGTSSVTPRASGAWPTARETPVEIEDRPSEERAVADPSSVEDAAEEDGQDEPRPSRRGSA